MKNKIFITILALIAAENAGYCISATMKNAIVKFSYAMAGVIISSVIIFIGLTIYNKIRDKLITSNNTQEEEILKTPKTKDEAIQFYIRRNKLK